ncbi:MAG: hypothetical protein ACK40G_14490 [Cytophagaceae bacterium]
MNNQTTDQEPTPEEPVISQNTKVKIQNNKHNSLTKTLLWAAMTILSIATFVKLIPIYVYDTNPIPISLAGAALTSVCFGLLIITFGNNRLFYLSRTPLKYFYFLLSGMILTTTYYTNYTISKENELKINGIITTGTITNLYKENFRRFNKYEITVRFSHKAGRHKSVRKAVNEDDFQNLYKNQNISLIYLPAYPEVGEFLISSPLIRKYTNSEERKIFIKDLIELLSMDNADPKKYLNQIYYGWTFDTKKDMWTNKRTKNSFYSFSAKTKSATIELNDLYMDYTNQLEYLGFQQVENNDDTLLVYESSNFIARIKTEFFPKVITTVKITKK